MCLILIYYLFLAQFILTGMMEMTLAKLIFGINFEFKVKDIYHLEILQDELKGYPDARGVDVVVEEVNKFEGKILSKNPSIHHEYADGFFIKHRIVDSRFVFEQKSLIRIEFRINEKPSFLSYLRKWNNIQFNNRRMRIGQLLHENIFVPATFFMSNLMPVHSSSIKTKKNGVMLFGGTGGVGKTSIEIKLGSNSENEFVSDDIAIVDDQRFVYKNLNYPKIYAYNAVGNKELLAKLIKPGKISEKIHWNLTKSFKGIDKVRRRIAPEDLYRVMEGGKSEAKKVFFLFKKDVPEMRLEELDSDLATELSLEIISNEYARFIGHLRWHNYNRLVLGLEPVITENELLDKWRSIGKKFYQGVQIYTLTIPLEIDHKDFLNKVEDLVTSR